jgi:hypothetical protein
MRQVDNVSHLRKGHMGRQLSSTTFRLGWKRGRSSEWSAPTAQARRPQSSAWKGCGDIARCSSMRVPCQTRILPLLLG